VIGAMKKKIENEEKVNFCRRAFGGYTKERERKSNVRLPPPQKLVLT
jgi:hypothetical protein